MRNMMLTVDELAEIQTVRQFNDGDLSLRSRNAVPGHFSSIAIANDHRLTKTGKIIRQCDHHALVRGLSAAIPFG